MSLTNASPTYRFGSHLDPFYRHRNTHPVREEEERRERRRTKRRGLDNHDRIDAQLSNNIYSNPTSSRSGDFAYSSKPFTIERSQLVSTAKNLVCSSAGR